VFPSVRSVLARCNYRQLDTTFQAVHPHVLSVPLAIIANESSPLVFVMAPTEKAELYRIFACCGTELRMPEYASTPSSAMEDRGFHFSCGGLKPRSSIAEDGVEAYSRASKSGFVSNGDPQNK
jgi:hypothetical protein